MADGQVTQSESINLDAKLPFNEILALGIQHVLTVFPGTIAVPLILASALKMDANLTTVMITATMFATAITTFIQVNGIGKTIGSKLPLVLGAAFAPLSPMIAIGLKYNIPAIFGAIIGSGIILFGLSFFMEKVVKFFPPVVVGAFVTIIGITLAPTAFRDLAGGTETAKHYGDPKNLLLGLSVLLIIILLSVFAKGMVKNLAILIGLIVGTVAAIPLGLLNLAAMAHASWFMPIMPFKFGVPEFNLGAILIMTLFCMINTIQCFGAFNFLDEVAGRKTSVQQQINGIRGQAFGQIIAGCFNSFPSSTFNENIGIIKLSRIGARSTIKCASAILLIISFSPKFCSLITCIPKPVIGGATLALFGTITAAGISILSSVNYNHNNNSIVLGTSMALGVGANFMTSAFEKLPTVLSMLLSNGLFVVAFSAVILNLIVNFRSYFPKKVEQS
uniref:Xanthine permease n=1 Tax=Loigolactobacillus rennini TaxID=238013 RepID=A0A1K2I9L7_9LACO|nr:Xanthine permease [Loigolactobacillus rennini]